MNINMEHMKPMRLKIIILIIHASALLSWSLPSEMYISTGNEIIQLQASTGDNLTARVLFDGLDEVEDLDVDRDHNMIYWVDTLLRSINRASVNDTSHTNNYETLINNDVLKPSCVAVDWVGGNIFFTDVVRKRIEVASADGRYRKVLIHQNLTAPTAIAVDVFSGYMFWIDNSSHPVIERASFDGSNRMVVVSEGLFNPHTLAIDYNSNGVPLLFWINTIEKGLRIIEYSHINGSNRTVLRRWDSTSYPSSLSVSGDDIFWTSNSRDGTIQQFNKVNNSTKTFFYQANKTVCDLNTPQIINRTVTPSSPCLQNVCDQICLTLPPGNIHKCTCSTGLKLRDNNRSCQNYPNQVLFTAHDTGIKYISLDIEDEFVDITFPVFAKNVNNVNFGVGHMIYWTEASTELSQTNSSAIRRSELNGSKMQTLVQLGLHTPRGLVIDNAGGNLFWIDGFFKRIEVSRLNGSSRKLLIDSGLTDPRSLAIDKSSRGILYWSDWGNGDDVQAHIERAHFDGSRRITVAIFEMGVVPLGITVDISTGLLYWADSNGTIESCNSRGRRRRIVYTSETMNIDGITIVGDYIYWIDKKAGTVWKASKTDATDARQVLDGLTQLRGISSADMLADSGGGSCVADNNLCSHLCLATGNNNARCECPTGLVLGPKGYQCHEVPDIMAYSKPDGIRFTQLGCHDTPVWLNVTTSDSMIAIDVEVQANRTYWIDKNEKKIYRTSNIIGDRTVVISSGLEQPVDLAVDWMGGNLYWTDRLGGKIEVSKLDGSNRRVVFTGLRKPTLIEVNPILGILYVVTRHGIIDQYRMDGQGDVIKSLDNYEEYTISAMTIDYENNHLYFKVDDDDQPYLLSRINSDFTELLEAVLDFRPNNFFYGHPLPPFAVHNGFLYLAIEGRGLLVFFTAGSTGVKCINQQVAAPVYSAPVYSTKIIHHERQPGFHWCQLDNGDCDGLCLPQKFGRLCQCPSHQIYDPTLNKCKDVDDFIVFSNTTGIYQIPITDNGGSFVPQMLPLGQGEINGVEYDSYTDRLYWIQTLQLPGSDPNTFDGTIRRGKLNGFDQTIVQDVTLINAPWFDMQLDQDGGHVFWTLKGGSQIEMVNTNGDGLAPFLSHVNLGPRSLALNPEESILYFVNWYGTTHFSSIQQLRLNSSKTEIVYEDNIADNTTGKQDKQDSLFYDSATRQLYWSDSKRQAVLRCSVESLPCTDVHTVLKTHVYSSLVFYIDGDFIYWYNSSEKAIYRANKYNGSNPNIFATGIVNLNDFTIGHRRSNLINTVCTGDQRPCTHLCIPKGIRFDCACPFGWRNSSNNPNRCEKPLCGEGEQRCEDGSRCIISQWVCDRHSDCPDGSDESPDHCTCHNNQFTCDNKKCAPLDTVCDGREHCTDGSDESYCACPTGYAKCPGKRGETCVPESFFCDRESDCESVNGTAFDEHNCTYDTFTIGPPPTPTEPPTVRQDKSYPAGHTVIIVVCTIMGGLIIVFLAFLILTVCYFSHTQKSPNLYKFNTSTATPDTSSRLSSTASETAPNSDFSVPTRSTNVLDSDGASYSSYLKQQQHHSASQFSLETAVMQEPIHYQPPNTPTTNKSVHFGTESVAYQCRAESPLTINDDTSYAGPCPSIRSTGMDDDVSHITSVSEVAKRRQEQEFKEYMWRQMYYNHLNSEDYDTTSITSADTKITYNSTSIEPPPPSLASRSMFMDDPLDDYD